MIKGEWKEQAFRDQLSAGRDFAGNTPVTFRYAICCGHRTGSNLLGESLYKTGQAGDPIEYFNFRFLTTYREARGFTDIDYRRYLDEMRQRRTSPNGVFGMNIKFDQLEYCFKNNWFDAISLIKDNDYVLFLYRRDRLRQAISLYIGQSRDVFNVPAGVTDEAIADLVQSVPFDPGVIAHRLSRILAMERAWLQFFDANDVPYEKLAYEDFVGNYDHHIDYLLEKFGVPERDRFVPEKPMKKIANEKNEELRRKFIEFVSGNLTDIND